MVKAFELYRKSSVKLPGGLFITSTFEIGLIEMGGRGGGGAYSI